MLGHKWDREFNHTTKLATKWHNGKQCFRMTVRKTWSQSDNWWAELKRRVWRSIQEIRLSYIDDSCQGLGRSVCCWASTSTVLDSFCFLLAGSRAPRSEVLDGSTNWGHTGGCHSALRGQGAAVAARGQPGACCSPIQQGQEGLELNDSQITEFVRRLRLLAGDGYGLAPRELQQKRTTTKKQNQTPSYMFAGICRSSSFSSEPKSTVWRTLYIAASGAEIQRNKELEVEGRGRHRQLQSRVVI